MRRIDIALLSLLGSAGQQDDDRLAIAPEINPIARTKIDPALQHTFAHAFDVGEIALLHAGKPAGDLGAGRRVQFREPLGEGFLTARGDVVADIRVTYMLPFASAKMQGLETPRESENVTQTASAERRAAKIETIQGFNSRRWSERGLNYWAVSDLAADGLAEFDDKFEASMRTSTAG